MIETNVKTIKEILEAPTLLLPIGFKDQDGKIHREVEIGEMTGQVEEAMSAQAVRNNGGKMITELVLNLTKRLGALTRVKKEHVRSMFLADRDFITLINYIQSVATDEFIRWTETCHSCNTKYEVELNYNNINVHYVNHDQPWVVELELPRGIKKGDQLYKKILVTFPSGEVQEKMAATIMVNPAESITQLLALITEDIEGLDSYSFETFREMVKKDRNAAISFVNNLTVGPDLRTETCCPACGLNRTVTVPATVLLGEG
ncbi:hypothetical protein D1872_130140 [compost metagenome]